MTPIFDLSLGLSVGGVSPHDDLFLWFVWISAVPGRMKENDIYSEKWMWLWLLLRLSGSPGVMRDEGLWVCLWVWLTIASAMGVDVLEGSDAAPLVFLELACSLVCQKGSPRFCSLLVVEYHCVLGEVFRFGVWNWTLLLLCTSVGFLQAVFLSL